MKGPPTRHGNGTPAASRGPSRQGLLAAGGREDQEPVVRVSVVQLLVKVSPCSELVRSCISL